MLALAIASAPVPGWAGPVSDPAVPAALTLGDAVHLALKNNPELRASDARVDAAAGRRHQAGRWSNPELRFGVEEWPVSGNRGFEDSKQTLGIAQTLPFPGKKSLDRRIGEAGVTLSEAEWEFRRTVIVRNVKAAFFRVLALERMVEVSTELLAVAESSATTARKRVDAGAAAFQEQLRAEVQQDQAHIEMKELERDCDIAHEVLATLVGQPGLRTARLAGQLSEIPDSRLIEGSVLSQLSEHPSLSAAQANLKRAELEHRRIRLDTYPDVTVEVAGGRLGESDESIVELGFSLPLPILDRGKGRRRESRANINVAEAELHTVQQELQREWSNSLKRYQTAAAQVTNYRERILPKAAAALRLVQTGFEEGKLGFIDLLDIQRTTTEAQLIYLQKLLEMNIAQVELEALLRQSPTHNPLNNPLP